MTSTFNPIPFVSLLPFICCLCNGIAAAQHVKRIDLQSVALGEKRTIKIWEPENIAIENPTQVIYVFDADWLFNSVCATVESASHYKMDRMPATIVVGIYYKTKDDRADVGYHVATEKLDAQGSRFLKYVNAEVAAYIAKQYKNTAYRTFIGWSYLAQYADYLMVNDPGFYDAYILFSPESKANNIDYSKIEDKRIYIASAGKDTQIRKDYAKELQQKMQVGHHKVGYANFENASHMDIYLRALPDALDFIYADYKSGDALEAAANPSMCYDLNAKANQKKYKTAVRKNARNFLEMASRTEENLTETGLDNLVQQFGITKADDANLLEITGSFYKQIKRYGKAEQYLLQAIANYKKENQAPSNAINAYVDLGTLYLNGFKNPKKAGDIFHDGYNLTGANRFNYYLAQAAMSDESSTIKSFAYLDAYCANYDPASGDYSLDHIYYLYAKACYELDDCEKAKAFNKKAIGINNENPQANALQQLLNQQ